MKGIIYRAFSFKISRSGRWPWQVDFHCSDYYSLTGFPSKWHGTDGGTADFESDTCSGPAWEHSTAYFADYDALLNTEFKKVKFVPHNMSPTFTHTDILRQNLFLRRQENPPNTGQAAGRQWRHQANRRNRSGRAHNFGMIDSAYQMFWS